MIDHVSLQVKDLKAAKAFYAKVFEPLGLSLLIDLDNTAGFGKRYPEVWLNARPDLPHALEMTGAHICLRARTEAAVRAFHEAAIKSGGTNDGAPGPRQAAFTTYFGAFIKDLDGNRLEAVTFPPPGE
ncbi:MAG: VOC family protein [Alphaproteobacteria bacterium]|nr:MAG: VOC family protein [Alphaproteobacteria bacterium]